MGRPTVNRNPAGYTASTADSPLKDRYNRLQKSAADRALSEKASAEQNKNILDAERKQTIINQTPVNRFGKPSDLNGMMLLLASEDSSFINGAELVIDGGYCITKI